MQASTRTTLIAAVGGLVVGLLLGFIPEYLNTTHLETQNSALTESQGQMQGHLTQVQNQLTLSSFAVRAGTISAQADANNYSVAGGGASSLFTDLRSYVDAHAGSPASQQLTEVLGIRDRTITGLAQADSAVKPLVQQIFQKLQEVSAAAATKSE